MQRLIAFIFVNVIQTLRTQVPPSFFHPDTNPVTAHALVYSVDKTHILVVIMQLCIQEVFKCIQVLRSIQVHSRTTTKCCCSWIHFFSTLSQHRKFLRFTRFRRSYANRPAVVLTRYCQSYTAFYFLMCAIQSGHVPIL